MAGTKPKRARAQGLARAALIGAGRRRRRSPLERHHPRCTRPLVPPTLLHQTHRVHRDPTRKLARARARAARARAHSSTTLDLSLDSPQVIAPQAPARTFPARARRTTRTLGSGACACSSAVVAGARARAEEGAGAAFAGRPPSCSCLPETLSAFRPAATHTQNEQHTRSYPRARSEQPLRFGSRAHRRLSGDDSLGRRTARSN